MPFFMAAAKAGLQLPQLADFVFQIKKT